MTHTPRIAFAPLVTVCLLAATAVDPTSAQADNDSKASAAVLNPNRATEAEMTGLPHLDATAVEKIIEMRPFLRVADLHAAIGGDLSTEQADELYARLFVPIDLNKASREEILLVPGIGPRMAHEFEEYRPYKAMIQFRREIGKYVDDDEVARLEQFVFVPIDLNTASDKDILSIPGVGRRMLHEFKEYRPYTSIEQFRREIGKYVDDDEVARLERYVTIAP